MKKNIPHSEFPTPHSGIPHSKFRTPHSPDWSACLAALTHIHDMLVRLELLIAAQGHITTQNKAFQRAQIIMFTIAEYFCISQKSLIGKCREARFVWPRHLAVWALDHFTDLTQREIAAQFGSREHSFTTHALVKVENLSKQELKARMTLASLTSLLETRLGGAAPTEKFQPPTEATPDR